MTNENYVFPRGFLWGAATSAYQIEGAWDKDGRGQSIWDTFAHTAGKIANDDTGDVACDHYQRYAEDVELMRQIGIQAYRFSIAWPRVMPNGKGLVNRRGLDFYDRLVDSLLERNIKPFVTLYHWDLPQALQDFGGWANRDVAGYFADFAAVVMHRLGDRVKDWITLNEPWVVAVLGNLTGEMAPGFRDRKLAAQVGHNLLVGHGLATQALRSIGSDVRIGIAQFLVPRDPAGDRPEDRRAAELGWALHGSLFLDPLFKGCYPPDAMEILGNEIPTIQPGDMALIAQKLDFLGVNYYTRNVVAGDGSQVKVPNAEYTEMGWEVCPNALERLLLRLNDDYDLPPIYITENGAALDDQLTDDGHVHDTRRIKYLHDHLAAIRKAMKLGVRVSGYFVWSLLDNFEWAHGYSKRFGLIHVDYATQKRVLKDSAYWYEKVIRRNEVHR